MKDAIEGMIKKGKLYEYTKDGEMGQEESPKKKQSKKTFEVVAMEKGNYISYGEEERHKGKCKYITSIRSVSPRASNTSKST